jgi:hypothetical protein
MTIKVYKVNPETGKQTSVCSWSCPPMAYGDPFSLSSVWPPCECPRCRQRDRGGALSRALQSMKGRKANG